MAVTEFQRDTQACGEKKMKRQAHLEADGTTLLPNAGTQTI